MKKLIPIISLVLIFIMSGCAAMQKEMKRHDAMKKQMESFVFSVSADKLYKTATSTIGSGYTKKGKYSGVSEWIYKNTEYLNNRSKTWQTKTHYIIKVTSKGKDKATLYIETESENNFSGSWTSFAPHRQLTLEHSILQKINPKKAAEITKIVSAAANK